MTQETERLSARDLERLGWLLDSFGIKHGELVEGAPQLSLNCSDGERVFVKVERMGAHILDRFENELRGARVAAEHGIEAPVPLVDHTLGLMDTNATPRRVTLWEFISGHPAPVDEQYVRSVVRILMGMAEVPVAELDPELRTLDYEYLSARIITRLDGLDSDVARNLLDLNQTFTARLREAIDPATFVWIHGDPHLHNTLRHADGHPMLIDWETTCRGPVEWEIAQLTKHLMTGDLGGTTDRDPLVKAALDEFASRHNADMALVKTMAQFRLVSSCSHYVMHGHDPVMLESSLAYLEHLQETS